MSFIAACIILFAINLPVLINLLLCASLESCMIRVIISVIVTIRGFCSPLLAHVHNQISYIVWNIKQKPIRLGENQATEATPDYKEQFQKHRAQKWLCVCACVKYKTPSKETEI